MLHRLLCLCAAERSVTHKDRSMVSRQPKTFIFWVSLTLQPKIQLLLLSWGWGDFFYGVPCVQMSIFLAQIEPHRSSFTRLSFLLFLKYCYSWEELLLTLPEVSNFTRRRKSKDSWDAHTPAAYAIAQLLVCSKVFLSVIFYLLNLLFVLISFILLIKNWT